jgi:hypothetical protein
MDNIGFYLTKSFDIFTVAVYYFVFGSFMSITINQSMRTTSDDELKKISTISLIIDIMFTFGFIGLGFYLIRLLVKSIPYPLDGSFGYEHSKLREVSGGIIVAYVMYTYQTKLLKKMVELKTRFNL